jgi:hypothetical protein
MLCCLAWCWGRGQRQGSGNHVEFCCWVVGLFGVRERMRIGEGSGWMDGWIDGWDGMGCMGTTWAHEVLASSTNPHRAGHPLATFFLVYFFSRLLFPTFSALRGHQVLALISLCLSVFLSLVSVASLLWLLGVLFLLYVCVCVSVRAFGSGVGVLSLSPLSANSFCANSKHPVPLSLSCEDGWRG